MTCENCKNYELKETVSERQKRALKEWEKTFQEAVEQFIANGPNRIYRESPPLKPGDLVMRKDGKKTFHDYASIVLDIIDNGKTLKLTSLMDGSGGYFFYSTEFFTLVPPKPKPEDIEWYKMTGEFRPNKAGANRDENDHPIITDSEPFWDGAELRIGFMTSLPVWILRRKREKRRVELTGNIHKDTFTKGLNALLIYTKGDSGLDAISNAKITIEYGEE